MRHLKMFGLAAFAAMAFTAFVGASTASATTLEVTKVTKNESIKITASVKAATTVVLRDTFGFSANKCKESHVEGDTTGPYTATRVTGHIDTLSFAGCDHTVEVHNPGQLMIEWTSGTNGRVYSENARVTSYSTIHGTHVTCTTAAGPEGTLIGTLTGSEHGHAEMHINATLNCGSEHLSSAKWIGTYIVTSPTGLGVSP